MTVIFWLAAGLLAYTYAGYPALIALLARLRRRREVSAPVRPAVSLLIVAHDEAARIERKIRDCLALDYPRDRLHVVVASDGSRDATAALARGFAAEGVRVLEFANRRGKPAVLNDVIPTLGGEVVVLADARQTFAPGAVARLAERFADPQVGAVSGELMLTNEAGTPVGEGVGAYWTYEKFIRRNESRFDSTVGATGAIYAIRRALFEPIPGDTLIDDVLIPMRIARRGYRVLFEPAAIAWDRASESSHQELTRKMRTIAGNFQMLWRERWMLLPWRNRLWLQTMSHKAARLLAPAALLASLVASAALIERPFYALAFAAQTAFYGAAGLGFFWRGQRGWRGRLLGAPYVFCLLNVTTVLSLIQLLSGRQRVTWQKA